MFSDEILILPEIWNDFDQCMVLVGQEVACRYGFAVQGITPFDFFVGLFNVGGIAPELSRESLNKAFSRKRTFGIANAL